MSDAQMSYRDYLIWTAAHVSQALSAAITTALNMRDEERAIMLLERSLDVARELAEYSEPSERVAAKPGQA